MVRFQAAADPAIATRFDARAVPALIRVAMRILELEQREVPRIVDLATRVGLSPAPLFAPVLRGVR